MAVGWHVSVTLYGKLIASQKMLIWVVVPDPATTDEVETEMADCRAVVEAAEAV